MDGITNASYRIVVKRIFDKYANPHPHIAEGAPLQKEPSIDALRMRTEFMNAEGYVRQPQRLVHHIMRTEFENQTIAQIY